MAQKRRGLYEYQYARGKPYARKYQGTVAETQGLISTIMGGDPGHVAAEKRRLGREIAANPLAAAMFFDPTAPYTRRSTGALRDISRRLSVAGIASQGGKQVRQPAMYGLNSGSDVTYDPLSDEEVRGIQREALFASEHGRFNEFINRQAGIIAQREQVEQARRRAPGRTQTILTSR